jgi:hypothetical protein
MPIHAKVSGTPIWQIPGQPVPSDRESPAASTAPDQPPSRAADPRRQDERGSTLNPLERLRLAALQVSAPAPPPIVPRPFQNRRDRSS